MIIDNIRDYLAYFEKVKENVVPVIEASMIEDLVQIAMKNNIEELVLLGSSPTWDKIREKAENYISKIYTITIPEGKSVNQFINENSRNRIIAFIEAEKAKQIKHLSTQNDPASDLTNSENPAKPPERFSMADEIGEMKFTASDRMYRIRGFNKDGFEKIVQVSLEIEGRSFPDKIDLSRSQSRMRFANIAGSEFELSPDIVRDDLAYIYKKLDKLQDERFKQKSGINEKNVHIITNDEIKKAKDHLISRDLLDEILVRDTEKLGFIGEEINKKLFYLSATSRLTGKPISVLDISPPGTGKSFGMSSIIDLIPADEVLKYSRLTPNALYYKSEEELRGKVLYIEEIVGMEESLEPIRMIISAEELAVSVVEKDPRTGTLRTVERRIKVSIPIISSGVRDIFDEETLSRFILTYNDVTKKHIEMILKSQSFKYSLDGEKISLHRSRFLKKHRDIQKVMDKSIVVINPYAEKIMVNSSLHIVTRKQEQYLRLIYNIAFLRQHSRERKKAEDRFGNSFVYIEVRKEDIDTANEIMRYVFQYASGDLTKRLHDAFQMIKSYCSEHVKEKKIGIYEFKFSRREIRDYAGWEQTTAKRIFDELEDLEYIRRVRGNKSGSRYLYQLVPFNERKTGRENLHLLDPDKL